MRNGLILLFAIAVITPLLVSAWLSQRAVTRLDGELRHQAEAFVEGQLDRHVTAIRALFDDYRSQLDVMLLEIQHDPRSIRQLQQKHPTVSNIIRLDGRTGDVLHPPLLDSMTPQETSFLQRTRELWDSRPRPTRPEGSTGVSDTYWSSFFWGHGLQLVRWRTEADGCLVGAQLRRTRVLADIIAVMPDSTSGARDSYRLIDAKGEVIYSWGHRLEGDEVPVPLATQALAAPVAAWRLEGHIPVETSSSRVQLSLLLAALIGAASGAAVLFYYKSSFEMRQAEQRVTFVNQVSHELKTPLTNLRLYTDLLSSKLPQDRPDLIRYANVLVSEGERLARLVHNVLTFGQGQRQGHIVHPSWIVPDEVVTQVVDRFRQSLASHGLEPVLELDAGEQLYLDPDLLTQAIGNLLNNVEKYAPGSNLVMRTRLDDARLTVDVEDTGPGVNEKDWERIFLPFERGSSSITEGVCGAGIGLALTRGLARAHGGDLTIEPRDTGVCFRLTLCSSNASNDNTHGNSDGCSGGA
jgi:signal transduction histidine kinase